MIKKSYSLDQNVLQIDKSELQRTDVKGSTPSVASAVWQLSNGAISNVQRGVAKLGNQPGYDDLYTLTQAVEVTIAPGVVSTYTNFRMPAGSPIPTHIRLVAYPDKRNASVMRYALNGSTDAGLMRQGVTVQQH